MIKRTLRFFPKARDTNSLRNTKTKCSIVHICVTEPSQESSEPVASQGNALGDHACAFQTKENVALNKEKNNWREN